MKKKTFEEKLNNPLFKYSKLMVDIVILNVLFILTSALSLMVLFFPSLVSLHKIMNNFVNDRDEPVYSTFFKEIKNQWAFNWRIEVLGIILLAFFVTLFVVDYMVIVNTNVSYIGYYSLIILIPSFLVFVLVFTNLQLFNNYYFDDMFIIMLKKSALIALKKPLYSLINTLIFISLGVLLFFIPYLIPFFSFTIYILIVESINRKLYIEIARIEEERALLPENLFLPVKVEEEK